MSEYKAIASEMGRKHTGPLDLDESIPFDIYQLFEAVTDRYYDADSHADELLILEIASAYESAAEEKA